MSVNTTTESGTRIANKNRKPICHTCREGKALMTRDDNGKPICGDCVGRRGDLFRNA